MMKGQLSQSELSLLPTSFDIVGDILIFADFPEKLEKKEKIIGEEILKNFKHLRVVCKKTGSYSGKYRTPILRIIAGEKRKETTHRENGVIVKLHVQDVYFSPRLAHERERINKEIKEGEEVLVMFSGSGVYPLNMAKNTKAKKIYGIEVNPKAHKYATENLKLNKAENIMLVLGDAKIVLPKMRKSFDRVLMPLPKSSEDFLGIAIPKVKKNGILHFYDFSHEKNMSESAEKVIRACAIAKRSADIFRIVKCGQYGPGKYRVCVDAKIF